MKKLLALSLMIVLAGCSQGGGGGSNPMCSSTQLQSPFSPGKVQVNALVADEISKAAMTVADLMSVPKTTNPQAIPAGTQLVATMKEACLNDGRITPSGIRYVSYTAPRTMTLDELRIEAEKNPCLLGLSDSVKMVPSAMTAQEAYTDPLVAQQTHLSAIEQPAGNTVFHNASTGITKDTVIAIIDTGVEISHEDLKDNLWVNTKEIPGNGIDDDHNGYIDDINGWNFASNKADPSPECGSGCNHGTHVAGLAAARGGNGVGGAGVMGEHVKIMALNVFGTSTSANNSDIDNAIRYAADNGADVINMSLGGSGADSGTQDAIQYALSKNVTVVVAAGNAGTQIDMSSNFENPASYSGMFKGVIAVGSVDTNTFNINSWSNYSNSIVKVAAPGSDSTSSGLLSTIPGNTYGRMQGTSMASPVAAGVAALAAGYMKSHGVAPNPGAVETALLTSGKVVSALTPSIKDGKVVNVKNLGEYVSQNLGGLSCQ